MVHTVAERPASSEGHSKLHDLISRSRKFKLLKGSQNEKGLLKARHAKASQDFHGSDTEGPDGTPAPHEASCGRLHAQDSASKQLATEVEAKLPATARREHASGCAESSPLCSEGASMRFSQFTIGTAVGSRPNFTVHPADLACRRFWRLCVPAAQI